MKQFRTNLVACMLALLVLGPNPATGTTITFGTTAPRFYFGEPITEGGFVYTGGGAFLDPAGNPGVAMTAGFSGFAARASRLTITSATPGATFTLAGLDVGGDVRAPWSGYEQVSFAIEGYRNGVLAAEDGLNLPVMRSPDPVGIRDFASVFAHHVPKPYGTTPSHYNWGLGGVEIDTLVILFSAGMYDWGGDTVLWSSSVDNIELNPVGSDVPEPLTLSVMGAGLTGLWLARRRRRHAPRDPWPHQGLGRTDD